MAFLCHYDVLICLMVAKLPGSAWFLKKDRNKVEFRFIFLIFLYCSSSMEIRERKKEIMPLDVFSLVMAFLTSATSLAAALVQYQTAKIAAQGTKKRANRRRNPRRRGHQKAEEASPPPPRAPKSGRSVAAATSASKRLTPLGWLMGPEGEFSSLYGASRRLPGAPTACGA